MKKHSLLYAPFGQLAGYKHIKSTEKDQSLETYLSIYCLVFAGDTPPSFFQKAINTLETSGYLWQT